VEHSRGAAVTGAWLSERLAEPARGFGVALEPAVLRALARYTELLLEWGARINLTGAKTAEALADLHLADALALLAHLPPGRLRFVDVGSGAGLPGLVLSLLRSDLEGVLLEPAGKKHAFLLHTVRVLGLAPRIEARPERLEAHQEPAAGRYDFAVSRAVWPVARWLELGRALTRPGGRILGVEGARPSELPAGAARHPYRLAGRDRAVIVLPV